ncbi:MAG TPA: DUF5686 family protein, partial [Bacteroidia bacterium]|nr:DUF5686 family protein [Bacteroidia bacterium]
TATAGDPALRIIRAASDARAAHDPENLGVYTCSGYTKTFATVEAPADTTLNPNQNKIPATRLDSLLNEQYLFLSESVSDIRWKKPLRQETIIASRVSGFQQPSLTLLATQLQSVSFYQDEFTMLDRQFLSPLAPNALSQYQYLLLDSIFENEDTLFIIHFEPKKGSSFNGLKGKLHISSRGYAIRDVTAAPVDPEAGMMVTITQRYVQADSTHWIPTQFSTEWYNNRIAISKGKLEFKNNPAKFDSSARRMRLVCRSYFSNYTFDTILRRNDFSDTELNIEHAFGAHDSAFWVEKRVTQLTQKEITTYRRMDSIGEKFNLDRKLKAIASAVRGRQKIGPIDIDMNRLISYNYFEGIRAGFGIHTNDDISDRFEIGGYIAYGFRDRQVKYGTDGSLFLYKRIGLTGYASWIHDVAEVGQTQNRLQGRITGTESYRLLFRRLFDDVERADAGIKFRAGRHTQLDFFAAQEYRRTNSDYRYVLFQEDAAVHLTAYEFTEAGFSIRYAFRERYGMVLGQRSLIAPSRWPVLLGEFSHGIKGLDFDRAQFRLEWKIRHFPFGEPELVIMAGRTWGEMPAGLLYSGRGTAREWMVSVRNTFETMGVNEFLSSRYLSVFYAHRIILHIGKKYRPEVVLRTSAGVGELDHPENHAGIEYKTMDEGYYESGVELNNVLRFGFNGFGIGALWRYGAYAFENPNDNLTLKISLTFVF